MEIPKTTTTTTTMTTSYEEKHKNYGREILEVVIS